MSDIIKIEDVNALAESSLIQSADFETIRNMLNDVCGQVAHRFNLFNQNGKPRKATIIDVLAKHTCLGCISKILSEQTSACDVDALYRECHMLAVNVLVEELYSFLSRMGYKVLILTEAELEYGKADILITTTKFGINLKYKTNELLVEVKTGNSLSLSQLFRYLLDRQCNTIIVWRVRRRHILVFNAQQIEPLLREFMKMICLRANRLLTSPTPPTCSHERHSNQEPTQEDLKKALEEFSQALVETLPVILQTILKEIENIIHNERKLDNG
jgi:hypothetical protein